MNGPLTTFVCVCVCVGGVGGVPLSLERKLNWLSVQIWQAAMQTNKHNCTVHVDAPTNALNIEGLDRLQVS